MRLYNITGFPNILQPNRQIKMCYSWNILEMFLFKERRPVHKLNQCAWSPAQFDGARKKENVTGISCLVIDVDEKHTMYEVGANLMIRDVKALMHTSVSHTPEKEKFRVILPMADDAPAEEWPYYYEALGLWWKELLGEDAIFDFSTKDASRLYFVGYHTEYWSCTSIDGKILNWHKRATAVRRQRQKEEKERRRLQQENTKKERARKNKLANMSNATHSEMRRNKYNLLRNCSNERAQFARFLGADISGDNQRAVGWACPRCNKKDATFFYIDPTRYPSAYCNHRKSCGFKESVGYLAEINGYF